MPIAKCVKHQNLTITFEQRSELRFEVRNGGVARGRYVKDDEYTGVCVIHCGDCGYKQRYLNSRQYPKWLWQYIESTPELRGEIE